MAQPQSTMSGPQPTGRVLAQQQPMLAPLQPKTEMAADCVVTEGVWLDHLHTTAAAQSRLASAFETAPRAAWAAVRPSRCTALAPAQPNMALVQPSLALGAWLPMAPGPRGHSPNSAQELCSKRGSPPARHGRKRFAPAHAHQQSTIAHQLTAWFAHQLTA